MSMQNVVKKTKHFFSCLPYVIPHFASAKIPYFIFSNIQYNK